jgi:hypothetical protein
MERIGKKKPAHTRVARAAQAAVRPRMKKRVLSPEKSAQIKFMREIQKIDPYPVPQIEGNPNPQLTQDEIRFFKGRFGPILERWGGSWYPLQGHHTNFELRTHTAEHHWLQAFTDRVFRTTQNNLTYDQVVGDTVLFKPLTFDGAPGFDVRPGADLLVEFFSGFNAPMRAAWTDLITTTPNVHSSRAFRSLLSAARLISKLKCVAYIANVQDLCKASLRV